IHVALPVLQGYIPDIKIIPADPTQWRVLIDRGGVDFLWAGAPVLYESLLRRLPGAYARRARAEATAGERGQHPA
ncbi:MAG: hypothetical protein ACO2PN_25460, partial [Pyrobaculum sp.]